MKKEILDSLKEQKIETLNSMQEEILKKAKDKDLVCISSTGSGKTFRFFNTNT